MNQRDYDETYADSDYDEDDEVDILEHTPTCAMVCTTNGDCDCV